MCWHKAGTGADIRQALHGLKCLLGWLCWLALFHRQRQRAQTVNMESWLMYTHLFMRDFGGPLCLRLRFIPGPLCCWLILIVLAVCTAYTAHF